jgi:hypothetical protein
LTAGEVAFHMAFSNLDDNVSDGDRKDTELTIEVRVDRN